MCIRRLAVLFILGLMILSAPRAGPAQSPLRPREGHLKVGDGAPDFTLKSPDGMTTFSLSAFRDKKPVVLIFGSYT